MAGRQSKQSCLTLRLMSCLLRAGMLPTGGFSLRLLGFTRAASLQELPFSTRIWYQDLGTKILVPHKQISFCGSPRVHQVWLIWILWILSRLVAMRPLTHKESHCLGLNSIISCLYLSSIQGKPQDSGSGSHSRLHPSIMSCI